MVVNSILADAVEVVKGFGYKCIYTKYKSTRDDAEIRDCYITDGVNIGYMQVADFNAGVNIGYMQVADFNAGVNFSTVHRGNKYSGSGFRLTNPNPLSRAFNDIFTIEQIDDDLIKSSFGKPLWAEKFRGEKWKSWDSYTKNSLSAKLGAEFIEM